MNVAEFVLEPEIATAATIPATWYRDPSLLDVENERVFSKTWQLVISPPYTCRVIDGRSSALARTWYSNGGIRQPADPTAACTHPLASKRNPPADSSTRSYCVTSMRPSTTPSTHQMPAWS